MNWKLELHLEGLRSVQESWKSSGSLRKHWAAPKLGQWGSMRVMGCICISPLRISSRGPKLWWDQKCEWLEVQKFGFGFGSARVESLHVDELCTWAGPVGHGGHWRVHSADSARVMWMGAGVHPPAGMPTAAHPLPTCCLPTCLPAALPLAHSPEKGFFFDSGQLYSFLNVFTCYSINE